MPPDIQNRETELNPEWSENIGIGIEEALDNYELLGPPLYFSPIAIVPQMDERGWNEVSDKERDHITNQLCQKLGVDLNSSEPVGSYSFDAPLTDDPNKQPSWQGVAQVEVYETTRKEEDMYLHQIQREGLEKEIFVAPLNFRL